LGGSEILKLVWLSNIPSNDTILHHNIFVCSLENKLEFGFWVSRYVFTFVTFLTGMKAPGILSARDISGESDEEVK
jgi:hypothetical protein